MFRDPESPDDSEVIAGWASWFRHEEAIITESVTTSTESIDQRARSLKGAQELLECTPGLATYLRERQKEAYSGWNRHRMRQRHIQREADQFISLRACFVLPQFRGMGIRSALVRYGCERADRLLLDMVVTSTPAAKKLYDRAGEFRTFGEVRPDLRDWSHGDGRSDDGKEATVRSSRDYSMWFMARSATSNMKSDSV